MDNLLDNVAKTLLQEFWLLSLSLEQLIEDDCWEEVPVLLQRRQQTLDALDAIPAHPNWLPMLNRALDADERCQRLLRRKRRLLVDEITEEKSLKLCSERYVFTEGEPEPQMEQEG